MCLSRRFLKQDKLGDSLIKLGSSFQFLAALTGIDGGYAPEAQELHGVIQKVKNEINARHQREDGQECLDAGFFG